MTNQEKVAAKIKELQEAVAEVGGSVMVISAISAINAYKKEEEISVMTGVTEYAAKLSEAIASLMTSEEKSNVSKIIKKGFVLAYL